MTMTNKQIKAFCFLFKNMNMVKDMLPEEGKALMREVYQNLATAMDIPLFNGEKEIVEFMCAAKNSNMAN